MHYSFSVFARRISRDSLHIYLAVAATILIFFSSSVAEADKKRETPLSLNEALLLSLEFHPLISARKREYQAAAQELASARWSAFPDASFSFRGFRKDQSQDLLDQEVLNISQPIWTGGKISGEIKSATAKRDASQMAIIEVEQELILETVKSFVDFNKAKLRLEIFASNVDEHQRLYNMIERRVKASTSPEVDLKLARARLAFSRSQLLQQTNALEASRASLEQLIGEPVFEVRPPQHPPRILVNLAEAEASAFSFSPKIRKMRAEIAGMKASERVSRSALYPQLSIGYEKKFGELPSGQEPEQVFVGLDFQPGSGLSAQSAIAVSRAKKAALQDNLVALKREIRREIQITWREVSSAESQLLPTKLLVDSTSDVVESYLRQYTVGRKSWLDVLNAQRELVQARQALEEHRAILTTASFKLRILVGDLSAKTMRGQDE